MSKEYQRDLKKFPLTKSGQPKQQRESSITNRKTLPTYKTSSHNDIQTSEGPTQQEKRRGKKTLSFTSIGGDF